MAPVLNPEVYPQIYKTICGYTAGYCSPIREYHSSELSESQRKGKCKTRILR